MTSLLFPDFCRSGCAFALPTLVSLNGKHNWQCDTSSAPPMAGGKDGSAAVRFSAVSAWFCRPRKSDEISCSAAAREAAGVNNLNCFIESLEFHISPHRNMLGDFVS